MKRFLVACRARGLLAAHHPPSSASILLLAHGADFTQQDVRLRHLARGPLLQVAQPRQPVALRHLRRRRVPRRAVGVRHRDVAERRAERRGDGGHGVGAGARPASPGRATADADFAGWDAADAKPIDEAEEYARNGRGVGRGSPWWPVGTRWPLATSWAEARARAPPALSASRSASKSSSSSWRRPSPSTVTEVSVSEWGVRGRGRDSRPQGVRQLNPLSAVVKRRWRFPRFCSPPPASAEIARIYHDLDGVAGRWASGAGTAGDGRADAAAAARPARSSPRGRGRPATWLSERARSPPRRPSFRTQALDGGLTAGSSRRFDTPPGARRRADCVLYAPAGRAHAGRSQGAPRRAQEMVSFLAHFQPRAPARAPLPTMASCLSAAPA